MKLNKLRLFRIKHISANILSSRSFNGNGINHAQKVLTIDTMNPHIKKVEYAVRGPIVVKAGAIRQELEQVRYFY